MSNRWDKSDRRSSIRMLEVSASSRFCASVMAGSRLSSSLAVDKIASRSLGECRASSCFWNVSKASSVLSGVGHSGLLLPPSSSAGSSLHHGQLLILIFPGLAATGAYLLIGESIGLARLYGFRAGYCLSSMGRVHNRVWYVVSSARPEGGQTKGDGDYVLYVVSTM